MTTMIRPGLLVALKTSISGGVRYDRRIIDPNHLEGDSAVSQWETTRTIRDAAEFDNATKTRGRIRTTIQRVCFYTSFGLLCPLSREAELQEAIREATDMAVRFNRNAVHTRIDVLVLIGRVADNDELAARSILTDVNQILDSMRDGVREADPEAIREAANKARAIAGMLSTEAQQRVGAAITEVRKVAAEIVRRVGTAGESAASVITGLKLEALENARFAVLDMDDGAEYGESLAPTPAPGRALDLPAFVADEVAEMIARDTSYRTPVPQIDDAKDNDAPAIAAPRRDVEL